MKYSIVLLICLIAVISYAQDDTVALKEFVFPGTNLKIELPNYFEPNNSTHAFPGFSDKNQTIIVGAQTKLDLTIQESFQKQLKSLNYNGATILENKSVQHNGDSAFIIEYQPFSDTLVSIIFMFGEKNAQNFISAQCCQSKVKEIKRYILSTQKDASIFVVDANSLGFSALDSSGTLKKVAKN